MRWKDDKAWADTYVTRIKELLGRELIVESSAAEDRKHATDFKVLVVKPYRFAYRCRDHHYWLGRYAHDFTLRSSRPRTATEKAKILSETLVDFYVYAFAAAEGPDLASWVMLDMARFRELYSEDWEAEERGNYDGSSNFIAYQTTSLPPGVIKACSDGYFDVRPKCTCSRCSAARRDGD
jgi:hypothetical protein